MKPTKFIFIFFISSPILIVWYFLTGIIFIYPDYTWNNYIDAVFNLEHFIAYIIGIVLIVAFYMLYNGLYKIFFK